jgi:hypothetical protein
MPFNKPNVESVKKGGFPRVWFKVGIQSVMDRVGTSNAKGVDRESGRQRYVTQERYVVNGIRTNSTCP